ncbi:RNA polymerase sigma-70 factor, ECF subfamily [Shimia marina]|uniref:Sigma-W factor n=1 Tax=Shimia marina TaxID=321267 RepID=A0A0P1F7D7_9RHOB|nr:Sigma-W factor [Shimia marina]SFE56993.1 RNA polymerase sigma-70 factor, ECF subfamily [Shimia marina]
MLTPWKRRSAQGEVEAGLPQIFPRVWRYAYSLSGTRDGADDLAQAACLRAMERARQFQSGTHLDRWVFRITRNLWVSELRKAQVRKQGGLSVVDAEEIADPGQNPERDYDRREVLQAVLDLPEAQRETVFLVYIEGYSYKEAAELLEIPLATVMSRLATARGRLSQKFRDQEGVSDAK